MRNLYWKISNFLEARYKQLKGGRGLLRDRPDWRDKLGLIGGIQKSDIEKIDLTKFYFDQKFYNICVFAAFTMAFSNQNGIRFSTRWLVKLARRAGYITGNGWSFLKAALKCAYNYGMLPYEYMSDEIIINNFNEYSKWTAEDEKLLEISKKYKMAEYRRLDQESEVIQALNNGYLIFTGMDWYSAMNNPQPPTYYLKVGGIKVGGHSIDLAGHRNYGEDFLNPQTYGQNYGDNGNAWIENVFAQWFYNKYIIAKLSPDIRFEHFLKFYDGKMVRTKDDPSCYLIKNGKKYHIPTIEIFYEIEKKIGIKNMDLSVFSDMLDKVENGGDFILPNDLL